MRTFVKKWGNSASVRIPVTVMEAWTPMCAPKTDILSSSHCTRVNTILRSCWPESPRATCTPKSVALADQVKPLDWVARRASRKGQVAASELAEVRAKLIALIGKP